MMSSNNTAAKELIKVLNELSFIRVIGFFISHKFVSSLTRKVHFHLPVFNFNSYLLSTF